MNRITFTEQPPDVRLIDVLEKLDAYVHVVQRHDGEWVASTTVQVSYDSEYGCDWINPRSRRHTSREDAVREMCTEFSGRQLRTGGVFSRKTLDLTNTKVEL